MSGHSVVMLLWTIGHSFFFCPKSERRKEKVVWNLSVTMSGNGGVYAVKRRKRPVQKTWVLFSKRVTLECHRRLWNNHTTAVSQSWTQCVGAGITPVIVVAIITTTTTVHLQWKDLKSTFSCSFFKKSRRILVFHDFQSGWVEVGDGGYVKFTWSYWRQYHTGDRPQHKNSIIICSPLCLWRDGWYFWIHKHFLSQIQCSWSQRGPRTLWLTWFVDRKNFT